MTSISLFIEIFSEELQLFNKDLLNFLILSMHYTDYFIEKVMGAFSK